MFCIDRSDAIAGSVVVWRSGKQSEIGDSLVTSDFIAFICDGNRTDVDEIFAQL